MIALDTNDLEGCYKVHCHMYQWVINELINILTGGKALLHAMCGSMNDRVIRINVLILCNQPFAVCVCLCDCIFAFFVFLCLCCDENFHLATKPKSFSQRITILREGIDSLWKVRLWHYFILRQLENLSLSAVARFEAIVRQLIIFIINRFCTYE